MGAHLADSSGSICLPLPERDVHTENPPIERATVSFRLPAKILVIGGATAGAGVLIGSAVAQFGTGWAVGGAMIGAVLGLALSLYDTIKHPSHC